MNLYIYTDESGVFDYVHNDYFVYGGIIFLSKEEKDIAVRKYLHVERIVKNKEIYIDNPEIKGNSIFPKDKKKGCVSKTFKILLQEQLRDLSLFLR